MSLKMSTVHTIDKTRLYVPMITCAFCHHEICQAGIAMWDHDQEMIFLHRRCEDHWLVKFPSHYRDADLEIVLRDLLANFLDPIA